MAARTTATVTNLDDGREPARQQVDHGPELCPGGVYDHASTLVGPPDTERSAPTVTTELT